MLYVVTHNPGHAAQAGYVYGPFKSHDAARAFAERCEAQGLIAATRRLITPDDIDD